MQPGEVLCLVQGDASFAFILPEHPLRALRKGLAMEETGEGAVEVGHPGGGRIVWLVLVDHPACGVTAWVGGAGVAHGCVLCVFLQDYQEKVCAALF